MRFETDSYLSKPMRVYWINPADEIDPITVTVAELLGVLVDGIAAGMCIVAVTTRGLRKVDDIHFVPEGVENVYYDDVEHSVIFSIGSSKIKKPKA